MKKQQKNYFNNNFKINFINFFLNQYPFSNYLFVDDKEKLSTNFKNIKKYTTIFTKDEELYNFYKDLKYNTVKIDIKKLYNYILPFPYDFIYTYLQNLEDIYSFIEFVNANISLNGV